MRMFLAIRVIGSGLLLAHGAPGQTNPAVNQEARAILQQLIEINTTDAIGDVTKASEAMAKRLIDAGFPAADVNRRTILWCAIAARGGARRFCS